MPTKDRSSKQFNDVKERKAMLKAIKRLKKESPREFVDTVNKVVDSKIRDPETIGLLIASVNERLKKVLNQVADNYMARIEQRRARQQGVEYQQPASVDPSEEWAVNEAEKTLKRLDIDCLIPLFRHKRSYFRIDAVELLGKIEPPPPNALELLINCLEDEDRLVRYYALKALLKMEKKESIEPLHKLLEWEENADNKALIKEILMHLERWGVRDVKKYDNI